MKHGLMYICQFDAPYYALATERLWWAPWRWKLIALELHKPETVLLDNASRDECRGLMKMLGVYAK